MNFLKNLFVVVAMTAVGLYAHDADEPAGITVTGTAVTEAKPDVLKWSLTVTHRGLDPAMISGAHAEATAALLGALRERGIKPEDVQTSGMRFVENREYRDNSWRRDGYIASTQVAFTLKDTSAYKEIWISLSRLNGVSVNWVSWDVSNRIALQNSTRNEALKAAKAKADQMAAALGVKVGAPLSISEELQENPWMAQQMVSNAVQGAQAQQSDESLAPGTVPVRIRVRVTFQILHL